MRARFISIFLLAAADLLLPANAHADIHRCNDANGNTLYTDSACPAGTRAVATTATPQACTTEECDRRRERELREANDRIRADKEELAAMTAERHKRESEERRLDEARYQAELRSAAATQVGPDEAVYYPAYPIVGYPVNCGRHCFPRRRVGSVGHKHDHMHDNMQGPRNHGDMRAVGNDQQRARPATGARFIRDRG